MNNLENEREIFENDITPFIEDLGYQLVEAVLEKRSKSLNIRIAIFSPNGITIDDCSRVSKALARDFSLDEKYGETYSLEVSSPGISRRLKRLREYRIFRDKGIELFLKQDYNGEKKISGIIKNVVDDKIQIERENGELCLFSLEDITKGRLSDRVHF
jgi:ribosome maturation factor RimP